MSTSDFNLESNTDSSSSMGSWLHLSPYYYKEDLQFFYIKTDRYNSHLHEKARQLNASWDRQASVWQFGLQHRLALLDFLQTSHLELLNKQQNDQRIQQELLKQFHEDPFTCQTPSFSLTLNDSQTFFQVKTPYSPHQRTEFIRYQGRWSPVDLSYLFPINHITYDYLEKIARGHLQKQNNLNQRIAPFIQKENEQPLSVLTESFFTQSNDYKIDVTYDASKHVYILHFPFSTDSRFFHQLEMTPEFQALDHACCELENPSACYARQKTQIKFEISLRDQILTFLQKASDLFQTLQPSVPLRLPPSHPLFLKSRSKQEFPGTVFEQDHQLYQVSSCLSSKNQPDSLIVLAHPLTPQQSLDILNLLIQKPQLRHLSFYLVIQHQLGDTLVAYKESIELQQTIQTSDLTPTPSRFRL